MNSAWGHNFFDNSMKTFLFKFHNNLLGTNTRVAHFVRNHSRTCTFCDLLRVDEENSESILHLFFTCNCVETLLTQLSNWLLFQNPTRYFSRAEFFSGFTMECNHKNFVLDTVIHYTKKFIWDCKLRYHIPTLDTLKLYLLTELKNCYKISRKFREIYNKCDLFGHIQELRF